MDTIKFIEKSSNIHSTKYDYSNVKYVKSIIPVEILCYHHGSFFMKPSSHLLGQGCPKCGAIARKIKIIDRNTNTKKTQKEFLERCMEIHGSRYDYTKTIFLGIRKKVSIVCRKHGEFHQMAQAHIHNKQGCPGCARELQVGDLNDFLNKAKVVFGEKYDYSHVDLFNKLNGKIKIICQQHGEFYTTPSGHINKRNQCSKCAQNIRAQRILTSPSPLKDEFIKRAQLIHGERYDYSETKYFRITHKVTIVCKTHGIFKQTPREHWTGSGCQKCAKFSTSLLENQWLDSLNIIDRQKKIRLSCGKIIKIDGYDKATNTVYEFFGDYWHGNPIKYNPNDINKTVKKTFGVLHKNTIDRIEILKNMGYNVIIKWESDWIDENKIRIG